LNSSLTALATGFWTFLFARALVGVGEGAYATISPSLISDFYPPEKRNRIMTMFYVAIPVGSALGFTLGGVIGQRWGWQAAFLVCGLPGLLVAAATFLMREPGRGTFDTAAEKKAPLPGWGEALSVMWRSKEYVCAVAGYTLVTFAAGGMADWFPTFLKRAHGMDLSDAGQAVGMVTVIGGLFGTAVGGLLADKLKGRTRQPYLALSGVTMVLATGCAVVSLQVSEARAAILWVMAAQFFLWCYNGPINAMIANSVPSMILARAFSVSILMIHLCGDAISPPIIGALSDASGDLPLSLSVVPLTMGLGAVVWLVGWRMIGDRAPVKDAPSIVAPADQTVPAPEPPPSSPPT
jgi:MFS transporter, Spinster family, sphingosine-1-phosphate transporter